MALLHCELKAESIRMVTSVCVILPQDFCRTKRPAKTLYLLHGRSHNYSVWTRYTSLEQYAEAFNAAIIMPEVNRSFYSNMKYGLDYQTYVSKELPDLCEAMFHISADPKDRYIAGMSMGGYGALKTALLHPDRYAGCGAVSAVTDIFKHVTETPESDPKKQEFQGIFGEHYDLVPEDDIFFLAARDADASSRTTCATCPDFYIACGTEDHLYPESVRLFRHLKSLPYQVTFDEWSGIHDWKFWDTAVKRVLEYFFAEPVM